jgi:hypothetical protein
VYEGVWGGERGGALDDDFQEQKEIYHSNGRQAMMADDSYPGLALQSPSWVLMQRWWP